MTDWSTVSILIPELLLVLLAISLFIVGTFTTSRSVLLTIGVSFLGVAGIVLSRSCVTFFAGDATVSGPLTVDWLGGTTRWMGLGLGLCFLLIYAREAVEAWIGETLGMVILTAVGLMLVSCSREFVLFFIGLELISIPTYVLLFMGRQNTNSVEAAAKYFFLSLLSSGLMLYGFAMLFGAAGSTDFHDIRAALAAAESLPGRAFVPIALVMLFAGLGFKISAVPFHFYAPDVYQATTNSNAGLLAVMPKVAGIVAMVRLLPLTLPVVGDFGWQVALILSLVTMTIGNVCALWQKNIRRMMAYSSIAHAGYMLIGIAVAMSAGQENGAAYGGFGASLLYVFVYAVASVGTFGVLAHLSTPEREVSLVDDLSGLSRNRPMAAALLAIFMFSLAGIPPLAGFWGKLTLFSGALSASGMSGENSSPWFLVLAVVGVLNAAIAAAYYLKIISASYFRSPEFDFSVSRVSPALGVAAACAILVLVAGILPAKFVDHFDQVGRSLNLVAGKSVSVGRLVDGNYPRVALPLIGDPVRNQDQQSPKLALSE